MAQLELNQIFQENRIRPYRLYDTIIWSLCLEVNMDFNVIVQMGVDKDVLR